MKFFVIFSMLKKNLQCGLNEKSPYIVRGLVTATPSSKLARLKYLFNMQKNEFLDLNDFTCSF